MGPPDHIYSALLLSIGLVCLLVAVVVWQQRRGAAGAHALILLMVAVGWWDLSYGLFWADLPQPVPFFWLDATYIGVVIAPAAFFVFTLQFTQQQNWLSRPLLLALLAEPFIVLLALWTDTYHGLFFGPERASGSMMLVGGPIFYVNIIYSYLLLLIACILLARRVYHTRGMYRRQAIAVLGAALITWINSIVFLLGWQLLPDADNTPFAFSLMALGFAYALLRYRLLDVMPVARHTLIETMSDGVIVLDARNRIVDANPAAQLLTGATEAPVGVMVTQVLAAYPTLLEVIATQANTHTEVTLETEPARYLDVQISPLYDPRQRLVGRLIVWRDITRLKRIQTQLEQLATIDMLTQVYNRRYFLELAEREFLRSVRYRHPLALVLIDLDYFKQINDRFGHPAGDKVLFECAQICRASIRESDIFARFGGEEFAVLMPETDAGDALMAAERIRSALATTLINLDGTQLTITASLGIAIIDNDDTTVAYLVNRADKALYRAKEAGRNQVVSWPAGLSTAYQF